jgi:hypothetical protein
MDSSALSLLADVATTSAEVDVQYATGTNEERLNQLAALCSRRISYNEYDAKNREDRRVKALDHSKKEPTKALRRLNQKALRVRKRDKFKANDRAYLDRLKEDPVRLEAKRATKRA